MIYINEDKLNNIKLTDNNFYVVMDFDETITTADSLNSWSILENPNFINPDLSKEASKLVERYYPIELDYTLDDATKSIYLEEWYYKNMDLLYKFGLTNDILINCVNHSNIKFRSGFKSFLFKLYQKNIPVIILSAGIGNVIIELLKANECLYSNISIISNFIKFDDNKMLPFNDKIIHTSNKDINVLSVDFANKIKDKNYILLFGNLIEDLNMVNKKDLSKTISFGFLEKNADENINRYRNSYDVVLTDNSSFDVVRDILNDIINKS